MTKCGGNARASSIPVGRRMSIAGISRWYWLAASVAIGVAVGQARQSVDELDLSAYSKGFKDQRRFEEALVAERGGEKYFKDVVVYPETVSDPAGGRRLVHVVCGNF